MFGPGSQPCTCVLLECGRLTSAPKLAENDSGDSTVVKVAIREILEKSDEVSICLVVLAVEQAVGWLGVFRRRSAGHDSCGKARLPQNGAGLQKVPDPIEDHALAIVFVSLCSPPVFAFDGNRVRDGEFFAKRFDLRGVQIVEVIQ